MKENYAKCLAQVLKYEGGYVDHPKDPGGPTNKGITQEVYDEWREKNNLSDQSVRNITNEEVGSIYRQEYWDRIRGDDLPSGVDFAVFDYAVNSGVYRAAKTLQAVVGVPQDGVIGPATIKAINAKRDNKSIALDVTDRRLAFMKGLAIWPTFGKGWSARISNVKSQILSLTK
jgi:lysozyme family protein